VQPGVRRRWGAGEGGEGDLQRGTGWARGGAGGWLKWRLGGRRRAEGGAAGGGARRLVAHGGSAGGSPGWRQAGTTDPAGGDRGGARDGSGSVAAASGGGGHGWLMDLGEQGSSAGAWQLRQGNALGMEVRD